MAKLIVRPINGLLLLKICIQLVIGLLDTIPFLN